MTFERTLPFNQLPHLPPEDGSIYDREVLLLLAKAHRSLGKLDGISRTLPNPAILVNTISLQEAKSSSEIENIFTTDDELYKGISTTDTRISPAAKEVLRYRESLWTGMNLLRKHGSIDLDTIIQIYQKIKQTQTGIRSEHSNVRIIKEGGSSANAEVVYTPPKGDAILDGLLQNLLAFLNNDSEYIFDPLLKMAIGHYQFEAIHPFPDGNGRTGRILNTLILMNKGLLSHPILYLSKYIIDNKESYYHYLNGVSSRGDWKRWLLYFLTAVDETSSFTVRKIEEITQQFDATRLHIEKNIPKIDFSVVEAIFTQPYVKAIHLVSDKMRSRNTARKYLDKLCDIHVLEMRHIGNEIVYINNDLVRILASE